MRDQIWTWTILAAIGVVVQGYLVVDSVKRRRLLRDLGENGDALRVLNGHVRSGLCYWIMHAVFLWIGLRILVPFNFGFVGWLFICSSGLLLFAGVADFYDRLYWRRNPPERR